MPTECKRLSCKTITSFQFEASNSFTRQKSNVLHATYYVKYSGLDNNDFSYIIHQYWLYA